MYSHSFIIGDEAAADQEYASGEEGDAETDWLLGGALQRPADGAGQLYPAHAGGCASRLPQMHCTCRQVGRPDLAGYFCQTVAKRDFCKYKI